MIINALVTITATANAQMNYGPSAEILMYRQAPQYGAPNYAPVPHGPPQIPVVHQPEVNQFNPIYGPVPHGPPHFPVEEEEEALQVPAFHPINGPVPHGPPQFPVEEEEEAPQVPAFHPIYGPVPHGPPQFPVEEEAPIVPIVDEETVIQSPTMPNFGPGGNHIAYTTLRPKVPVVTEVPEAPVASTETPMPAVTEKFVSVVGEDLVTEEMNHEDLPDVAGPKMCCPFNDDSRATKKCTESPDEESCGSYGNDCSWLTQETCDHERELLCCALSGQARDNDKCSQFTYISKCVMGGRPGQCGWMHRFDCEKFGNTSA